MHTPHAIPALQDNYIWAFPCATPQPSFAIVDPGDAAPVLTWLAKRQASVSHILITHHHQDHVGGVLTLKKHFPKAEIWCGPTYQPPWATQVAQHHHSITLPGHTPFRVLPVPGHTLDHIAFVNSSWLFCGDTLFSLGCGRVFEGTLSQMYQSLCQLKNLDDDLWVCAGHEYTLQNAEFALSLTPNDPHLIDFVAHKKQQRQHNLPTLPVKLGMEKQVNPFLRTDDKAFRAQLQYGGHLKGAALFAYLREQKDMFTS